MRKLLLMPLVSLSIHASPSFDRQLNELYERKPWLAPEARASDQRTYYSSLKRQSVVALYGLARGYVFYRAAYGSSSGQWYDWLIPEMMRSVYRHATVALRIVQLGIEVRIIDRGLAFLWR